MDNKTQIALKKFLGGYNCSQAVIYAFAEELNLDKDLALKLSCGFGAGMGRTQEVCGALSGGIIVIGGKYGRGENQDKSAMELTYHKTGELIESFKNHHATISCRLILEGCDLRDEKGKKHFKENDFLTEKCAPCVETVVKSLEELIHD